MVFILRRHYHQIRQRWNSDRKSLENSGLTNSSASKPLNPGDVVLLDNNSAIIDFIGPNYLHLESWDMETPSDDRDMARKQDGPSFHGLINAAKEGNENAIAELINCYRKYMLLIANNEVGQDMKAKLGASDAVQESVMHAQLNFHQFQGNTEPELKAWLRAILGNDIRKNRRKYTALKRDANREINMQDQSAIGRGLADAQLTPSSDAVRQEKEKAISVAMSQLSKEQQQVIRLRNFEQKSFLEIGQEMNRTADAARKFWARSIDSLKTNLKAVAPGLVDLPPSEDENE